MSQLFNDNVIRALSAGIDYLNYNGSGGDYAGADDAPWAASGSARVIDYSGDDESGDDESGDDESGDDESGAAPRRGRRGGRMPMRGGGIIIPKGAALNALKRDIAGANERAAAHQARAVAMESKLQDLEQLDLPVNFTTIAGGASQVITVTSPEPIKIVNFFMDSLLADFYKILSISVGRLNLFLSSGGVPANTFTVEARRGPFKCPKIPASVAIAVLVQNRSGGPQPFDGTLTCRSLIESAGN